MSQFHSAPRRFAVGVLAAAALFGVVSCSSSDEAADSTCADMQDLAAQVRGLADVNLVQSGLDGLEQQTDAISTAWDTVKKSSGDQFGSELDDLESSVTTLTDTLTGMTDDGKTLSENISAVEGQISDVADSWSTLTTAVEAEMGDCDLSASGG